MERHSLEGSAAAINWPALSFSRNLISVEKSLESHASRLGQKKRFFEGMVFVDTDGKMFRVAGARKIRLLCPRPASLVSDFLGLVTGNPQYAVRLVLDGEKPQTLSVSDVKLMIFRAIGNEPSWQGALDLDELKHKIETAMTVTELITIFRSFR